MADFHMPSSAEIRAVLEALPEEPLRVKLGSFNIPIDGLTAKMGFLYEYLIAGRICEVAGKYAPQRRHAIELKMDHEPAIMFAVKTAKRKTKRGWSLRPATVPLDQKYEPLTGKVYNYIKQYAPEEHPFLLHENPDTSKRYAEAYAKQVFETYRWHFVDYNRSAYADPSLGFTYDIQTRQRVKIKEEKARVFGSKISFQKVDGWVPVNVEVEGRWKSVNTHELRKARLRDLESPYYFDSIDLNYYAGWEGKDKEKAAAARHYLELDLDESPENIRKLAERSKRYFKKLLIPIKHLLHPEDTEIGGIEIIG